MVEVVTLFAGVFEVDIEKLVGVKAGVGVVCLVFGVAVVMVAVVNLVSLDVGVGLVVGVVALDVEIFGVVSLKSSVAALTLLQNFHGTS